jgi:hypothetical protein
MVKKLLFVLLVVFFGLNLRLIILINGIKKANYDLKIKEQTLSSVSSLLEYNILFNSENSCTKIKDLKIAVNGEQMLLSEYVSGGPKLVFYSSVDYCSSCVASQIKVFREISDHLKASDSFILFSDVSLRDINIIKNTYSITTDIVSLNKESLGFTNDGVEVPLSFVVTPDLKVFDVMKLYKNMNELNKQYFNNISIKYWSEKSPKH